MRAKTLAFTFALARHHGASLIAHRFKGRNPSIPTFLTETGHRHSSPDAGEESPAGQPPEPSGRSPPLTETALPTPPAPLSAATGSPPMRPMRNAERIAADRRRITDGGVLDILLDHIRGERELSPSQVSTAFGLLKKILPDFSTSAPPRDHEESREGDGAFSSSTPSDTDFEIHIVDPQET
jgi:hypothetical protein